MKIKANGSYRNAKGNIVFRYLVSGSNAELDAYKAAQGDLYRETEDGHPIWFTTRYIGEEGRLIFTSKGTVVADTSVFDKAASIAAQYGGNLGDTLIKEMVGGMLGNFMSKPTSAPSTGVNNNASTEENKNDVSNF